MGTRDPSGRHERLQWARAIFDEVVELPEPERVRTLRERCADDAALFDLVLGLLGLAEAGTGDFLESSIEIPPDLATTRIENLPNRDATGSTAIPTTDPERPRVGRYEIFGELGRGGMGVVYRGHDPRLRRDVAIKVLPERVVRDPRALRGIEEEARLLAAVSHPNIAVVHSLEEDDGGRLFFTQELVEGPTLEEFRAGGRMSLEQLLPIATQLVRGIQAAHRAGIVHRDLKPSNVKVTSGGEIKVLDFGISAMETVHAVAAPVSAGTPGYMSPEQVRGAAPGVGQDVWALGCCMFECLSGAPPFGGRTTEEILSSTLHGEPEWDRLPPLPEAVRSALQRTFDRDPIRRIGIEDLRAVLETESLRLRIDAAKNAGGPESSNHPVPEAHPSNLPEPPSAFFGRAALIESVLAALGQRRTVALTGMGGSGKTRLALEVGRRLLSVFPGGVWYLPVIGDNEEQILQELLGLFGLRDRTSELDLAPLLGRLEDAELLLILDGWEATRLADLTRLRRVLAHGSGVRTLIASRRPLHLGEAIVPVPPLDLPSIAEYEDDARSRPVVGTSRIRDNDAVRLFVDRAQLASPSFRLTEASAPTVYRLVRRLDGLPLALELAAARLRVLSVEELLTRLDDRFRLLRTSSPQSPGHGSLRAILEWSHEQLDPNARALFRRLATFRGGWTLEAAEDVCAASHDDHGSASDDEHGNAHGDEHGNEPGKSHGDSGSVQPAPLDREDVLDLLEELIGHSLVEVLESQEGASTRYSFLHSVREFAEARLEESRESSTFRSRHVEHFLRLAETAHTKSGTAEQARWNRIMEQERDNFWEALGTCRNGSLLVPGLRLAAALSTYWVATGSVREGRRFCEEMLSTVSQPESQLDDAGRVVLAHVQRSLGNLTFFQADFETARTHFEIALGLYRGAGDLARQADTHRNIGWAFVRQGDFGSARREFAASLELGQRSGNMATIGAAFTGLGTVEDDTERSLEFHERALAVERESGRDASIAGSLMHIGNLALNTGNVRKSRECLEEALEIHRRLENPLGVAWAYTNLGIVAYWERDYEGSLAYFEDTLEISEEREASFETAIALGNIGILLRKQKRFDEARPYVEESLALRRQQRDRHGTAEAQHSLGLLHLRCGHRRRAEPELLEALRIRNEIGDPPGIAASLEALAALALETGDLPRSARLFGAAEALRLEIRAPLSPPEAEDVREDREQLAEACRRRSWTASRLEHEIETGARAGSGEIVAEILGQSGDIGR